MVTARSKRHRLPFTLLIVMLALLLSPTVTGAADPPGGGHPDRFIDQQQTIADTVATFAEHHVYVAQTFIAGETGILFGVEIPVRPDDQDKVATAPCVRLSIWGVAANGGPDRQSQLASAPEQCFPNDHQIRWMTASLGLALVAKRQYAIVSAGTGAAQMHIFWYGSARNVYPKGTTWGAVFGNFSQSTPGSNDAAFKTYVLTKDGCKDDGWKQVTRFGFKNQGECIKYVKDHA